MHLPWKKAKSGRISRLMADLQQSPKRGGSLVVETGFPTSLIDLFVKNRDRLKKPSSNKRRQSSRSRDTHIPPPSPPRRMSSFPCQPSAPTPAPPPPREEPIERRKSVRPNTKEEEEAVSVNGDCRDSAVAAAGVGGRCVFAAVLKVFVVVVLALSTKKLTVGITLSAFTLVFLEFAAARVFTLFKLCPDARVTLDSLIQRVLGKRQKEKQIKIDDGNVKSCEITETFEDSNNFGEEIRYPESYAEAISCPEPESAMDRKKTGFAEEERGETIRELMFKNERSRSSNLKSRIVKKIVPKKLRSSKKKKKSIKNKEKNEDEECLSEASSVVSDDKSDIIEEEISERDKDKYDLSNLPPPPLQENCRDRESQVVWKNNSAGKSESPIESKGDNIRHLMILVVVVLSGLLCGRVLAIVLSLFWCSVLRFAEKIQIREEK